MTRGDCQSNDIDPVPYPDRLDLRARAHRIAGSTKIGGRWRVAREDLESRRPGFGLNPRHV